MCLVTNIIESSPLYYPINLYECHINNYFNILYFFGRYSFLTHYYVVTCGSFYYCVSSFE